MTKYLVIQNLTFTVRRTRYLVIRTVKVNFEPKLFQFRTRFVAKPAVCVVSHQLDTENCSHWSRWNKSGVKFYPSDIRGKITKIGGRGKSMLYELRIFCYDFEKIAAKTGLFSRDLVIRQNVHLLSNVCLS